MEAQRLRLMGHGGHLFAVAPPPVMVLGAKFTEPDKRFRFGRNGMNWDFSPPATMQKAMNFPQVSESCPHRIRSG